MGAQLSSGRHWLLIS